MFTNLIQESFKPSLDFLNSTMADDSALDVCHQLLYQVRLSNLHFALSETPYSVQIVIRKRFLKDSNGPSKVLSSNLKDFERLKEEKNLVSEENDVLKDEIEALNKASCDMKETIQILEQKITKIEAAALKSFEDRSLEMLNLKNALKNLKTELEISKKEITSKSKIIKEKEKENYKLDQKTENLEENVRKIKTELGHLKSENKNLKKKVKINVKLKNPVLSKATSTILTSPATTLASTSCSRTKTLTASLSSTTETLTASSSQRELNPTASSNAATSPPPLGLPGLTPISPRTPPGTPPCLASQLLQPTACKEDLNKNKYCPIDELKEKIARDSPNFDELVEFVRNSNISFEDSHEDEYSDMDYENYLETETHEEEEAV